MQIEGLFPYKCPACDNAATFKKLVWEQRLYLVDDKGESVDLSEPTAGTEHILELACVNCFHLLVDNEITVHEICKHQRSEASDRLAKKLFDQMTEVVPRSSLWPVAVGLLRHLLLHPKATLQKYQYGVFAMTDVLRDAGDLLQGRGEAVPNIDLHELSRLRRRNLRL